MSQLFMFLWQDYETFSPHFRTWKLESSATICHSNEDLFLFVSIPRRVGFKDITLFFEWNPVTQRITVLQIKQKLLRLLIVCDFFGSGFTQLFNSYLYVHETLSEKTLFCSVFKIPEMLWECNGGLPLCPHPLLTGLVLWPNETYQDIARRTI